MAVEDERKCVDTDAVITAESRRARCSFKCNLVERYWRSADKLCTTQMFVDQIHGERAMTQQQHDHGTCHCHECDHARLVSTCGHCSTTWSGMTQDGQGYVHRGQSLIKLCEKYLGCKLLRRARPEWKIRLKGFAFMIAALHIITGLVHRASALHVRCQGGQYLREFEPITSITTGALHTCSLHTNGNIICWGGNSNGQLGYGDTARRAHTPLTLPCLPYLSCSAISHSNDIKVPKVDLGTNAIATTVAAGMDHTCAILGGGALKCWGRNDFGQLGAGTTEDIGDDALEMGNRLLPVSVGTGRRVVDVALGRDHTCAILDRIPGDLKCWGRNLNSELGLGDNLQRGGFAAEMGDNLPIVNLGSGRKARQVVLGSQHTCVLLETNDVKCWGRGYYGQLGYGDIRSRGGTSSDMGDMLAKVQLGTDRTAQQIAAGQHFTCAILDNGLVKCWGRNQEGQLGLGDVSNRGDVLAETGDNLPAVSLGTGRTAMYLAVGLSNAHMCSVLDNFQVKCWGYNRFGQLGLGDLGARGSIVGGMGDNLPKVDLGSIGLVTRISIGYLHTCVIVSPGPGLRNESKCFGYNYDGQLGLGDSNYRGGNNDMGANLAEISVLLSGCLTCPAMTYSQFATSSTCNQCMPSSQSLPNSPSKQSCVCNKGYTGNDGGPCTACSRGFFKSVVGSSECITCGQENIDSFPASDSPDDCMCSANFYKVVIHALQNIFHCNTCPSNTVSFRGTTSVGGCFCNAGFTGQGGGPCDVCQPGTYKDVIGSDACQICPPNSFSGSRSTNQTNCSCNAGYSRPPGGLCFPCSLGKFINVYHLDVPLGGQCLDCPAHSSTLLIASMYESDCICNQGYYGPDGGPCVACPYGSFKAIQGSSNCIQCPVNAESERPSASIACRCIAGTEAYMDSCRKCPIGKYRDSIVDGCVECPLGGTTIDTMSSSRKQCGCAAGFYGSITATTSDCRKCMATTTSVFDSNLDTDCVCPGGWTGPNKGPCTVCLQGKYKESLGSAPCVPCPIGFTTMSDSSTSIADCKCAPGYSRLGGGSIILQTCTACAPGKYKSEISNFGTCEVCPEHSFSRAASKCICAPTFYGHLHSPSDKCTLCPDNAQTDPLETNLIGDVSDCRCLRGFSGPFGGQCQECPENTYSKAMGMENCILCPMNAPSPAQSSTITNCTCLSGWKQNSDLSCTKCLAGTYLIENECKVCPIYSSSTAGSEGSKNCLCALSYFQVTDGPEVDDNAGFGCRRCPDNSLTLSKGSLSMSQCVCDINYYAGRVDLASLVCSLCPRFSISRLGTENLMGCYCRAGYSGTNGQVCAACLAGKYKSFEGAGNCIECDVGKYKNGIAGESCVNCIADSVSPAGSVSSQSCLCRSNFHASRFMGCQRCSPNSQSEVGGALRQTDCQCNPGFQARVNFSADTLFCEICESGFYKGSLGNIEACQDCPANAVSALGSTSIQHCLCGPGFKGAEPCIACPPGSIKPTDGNFSCTICPANANKRNLSIWSGKEAEICECNVGYYGADLMETEVILGGFEPCASCSSGTYTDRSGSIVCTRCPFGSISLPGSSLQTDCKCNKMFTGPDGGPCLSCLFGTYKHTIGSAGCTCISGSARHNISTPCFPCRVGKYQVNDFLCQNCPAYSISNEASSSVYDCKCEPGRYMFFNPNTEEYLCQQCPVDSYSDIGSEVVDNCFCNAGYYSVGPGECVQCCNNTYSELKSIKLEQCQCNAGYYLVSIGDYRCDACLQGSTSVKGSTNVFDCKCLPGFSGVNGAPCSECPAGTYKTSLGSSECLACPSNSLSTITSTNITDCICKIHFTGPDGGPCEACAQGLFNFFGGTSRCSDCPRNSQMQSNGICTCLAGFTGGDDSDCDACPPGKYKQESGTSLCIECELHAWSSSGSTGCLCKSGHYRNMEGSCLGCSQGTYKNDLSDNTCKYCPKYSFSAPSSEFLADCKCSVGRFPFYIGPGSFECKGCLSPYAWPEANTGICLCNMGYTGPDNGMCLVCARGKYKTGVGSSPCMSCRSHSDSPAASKEVIQCLCNVGYQLSVDECTFCVPGQYKNSQGNFACSNCEPGTYSDKIAQTSCEACPEYATTTRASFSIYQCTCLPGFTGNDAAACTPCEPGSYKSVNGTRSCAACNAGEFTPHYGSTACSQCTGCPPGSYVADCTTVSAGTCYICPRGTFKPINGTIPCTDCPPFSESPAGSVVLDSCLCAPGYFRENVGASVVCTACPPGQSSFLGSLSLSHCNCATGSAAVVNGLCEPCTQGKYKDDLALKTCLDCPAGKFSTAIGSQFSWLCIDCPIGKYQSNTGASMCTSCPSDTFSSDTGAVSLSAGCFFCPLGQYQDATEKSVSIDQGAETTCMDCIPCDEGYFRDGCKGNLVGKCTLCTPGTYKDTIDQEKCRNCPVNQISPIGSISLTSCSCEAGYTGMGGKYGCTACGVGKYKSIIGTSPCDPCPRYTTSRMANPLLESCTCLPGYYGANGRECRVCAAGKFKDEIGGAYELCRQCPLNSISEPASITVAQCFCKQGYSMAALSEPCVMCPEGTYKDSVSNIDCTACSPFSSAPDASTDVTMCSCNEGYTGKSGGPCVSCTRGTYKSIPGSTACTYCPAGSSSPLATTVWLDCKCDKGFTGLDGGRCDPCPACSYKPVDGDVGCISCPAFSISPEASTNLMQCRCQKGYNGPDGQDCVACLAGKYKSQEGLAECLDCPANSNSFSGAVDSLSCRCLPGFSGGPNFENELEPVFDKCFVPPGSNSIPQNLPETGLDVLTVLGEGVTILPGALDTTQFKDLVLTVTLLDVLPSQPPKDVVLASSILKFQGPSSVMFQKHLLMRLYIASNRREARHLLAEFSTYINTFFFFELLNVWTAVGPHSGPGFDTPGWPARVEVKVDPVTGRQRRVALGTINRFATYAVLGESCQDAPDGVQRDRCHCVQGYTGTFGGICVQCRKRVFWVDLDGSLRGYGSGSCVEVSLSSMGIKTIPAEVFGVEQIIVSLDLSDNFLTTLPSDTFIGLGANLVSLDLSGNKLQSMASTSLRGLRNLTNLDLSSNELTSLPPDLFYDSKLVSLKVSENKLECTKDEECVAGVCSSAGVCTSSCRTYEDLDMGCLGMCTWKLGSRCFPGHRCDDDRVCYKLPAQAHWIVEQIFTFLLISAILYEIHYVLALEGEKKAVANAGASKTLKQKVIPFKQKKNVFTAGRKGLIQKKKLEYESISDSLRKVYLTVKAAEWVVQAYLGVKFVTVVVVCIKFNGPPESDSILPADPTSRCVVSYFDHMILGIMCILECLLDYFDVKKTVILSKKFVPSLKREVCQVVMALATWGITARESWAMCEKRYLDINMPGGSQLHIYVVPLFSLIAVLSFGGMGVWRCKEKERKRIQDELERKPRSTAQKEEAQNEHNNELAVNVDVQVGIYKTSDSVQSGDSTSSDLYDSRKNKDLASFGPSIEAQNVAAGLIRAFHLLKLRRLVSEEIDARQKLTHEWVPSTPYVSCEVPDEDTFAAAGIQISHPLGRTPGRVIDVKLMKSLQRGDNKILHDASSSSSAVTVGGSKAKLSRLDVVNLLEFNRACPPAAEDVAPTLTLQIENCITRLAASGIETHSSRVSTSGTQRLNENLVSNPSSGPTSAISIPRLNQNSLYKTPSRTSSVVRQDSNLSSSPSVPYATYPSLSTNMTSVRSGYSNAAKVIIRTANDDLDEETQKLANAHSASHSNAASRYASPRITATLVSSRIPAATSPSSSQNMGPMLLPSLSKASLVRSAGLSDNSGVTFRVSHEQLEARMMAVEDTVTAGLTHIQPRFQAHLLWLILSHSHSMFCTTFPFSTNEHHCPSRPLTVF